MPPGGQTHPCCRHRNARHCDSAHKVQRIEVIGLRQRRALHLDQIVDRHAFRVGIKIGQLCDQAGTLGQILTHADDAAAAHMHASFAHALQRVQPVLIIAGADDVAIEFRRGIQIMVVVIQPGIAQLLGLRVVQHAQRGTGFHAQPAHRLDHLDHTGHVLVAGFAPGCAHAEAICAALLSGFSCLDHFFHFQHLAILHTGGMKRRLRAITAVFGTAACLDRKQGGKLHRVRIEMLAVYQLRPEYQIGERQLE